MRKFIEKTIKLCKPWIFLKKHLYYIYNSFIIRTLTETGGGTLNCRFTIKYKEEQDLNLGEFIKEERLNRGLTQIDLAKQVGVSFVTINKIENTSTCGIRTLSALSDYFGVSLTELRSMVKQHENN